MNNSILFFNRCFDKKRLKNFILWFFSKYGERATIQLIESLKEVGFQYATKAGISIGIDDLQIPFIKSDCINITEHKIKGAEINYQRGNITEIERQQQFVDEWSFVSEKLKRHVIQFFKATDVFNPIYMMAFSGARGNISQIRQLIGMRGLMADPQGQILDFPIRSSFREGLTLTEYLISCYGARKGVVDTALRTATSGYLTRRLVDVTQQVVIGRQNCYTNRGIQFTNLMDGTKTLLSLKDRLVGRILLNDIFIVDSSTKKKCKIGFKDQEISPRLSRKIYGINNRIVVRSPLTCYSKNSVCQLCYGWNLAYNAIVSIGEAVGVLAAQSIGEPGTQLTMRTFHTGGVFTGGFIDQIYAPFSGEVNYVSNFKGVLIRTLKGRVGFLTKTEGALQVKATYINNSTTINSGYKTELANLFFSNQLKINSLNKNKIQSLLRKILTIEKNFKAIKNIFHPSLVFNIPIHTILFTRHSGLIFEKELIAELSSISISDSRQQETEQEIFTPIAGQIFFENLILIEKTKRDGSIQKMTYGLGSLWVVSATEWRSLIHPSIFPHNGDFISSSSVIQKLQILAEKFYYFDKSISDSIQNFQNFKANSFLTRIIPGKYSKPQPFDNISLNRTFYSYNFRKIYYQSFRYFVYIKSIHRFLNVYLYSKNNNLSIREQFIKNNKPKVYLNSLILGLNFKFYQNNPISRIQKQKSKPNFSLYSIQNNINQIKSGYFYSFISYTTRVKSKLKRPIFSRKLLDFPSKILKKNTYQYWCECYSLSAINLLSIPSKPSWTFSKKKLSTSFDFILSQREDNFDYFLKIRKSKTQQQKLNIIQFQKYKVSRFFFTNLKFGRLFLYFSSAKIFKIFHKYNWILDTQTTSLLVNRQSIINLQLSKHWYLSNKNTFQPNLAYSKMSFQDADSINLNKSKKLSPYIFHSFLGQFYNIKPIIKPILINPGLLLNLYNKKFHLHCYIIQKFFLSFYYEYFLSLKLDNYFFNSFKKDHKKIGFQTQFKVSIIPTFINIKNSNTKTLPQIKRIFFKNEIFTFLQKNSLLNKTYKKQQNNSNWPCTYRKKFIIKEFGYFFNFGADLKRNNCFDRQQILVDIIYNQVFCKFSLLTFFSYRNFHKLKIRFSAHRLLSKNLIIFQKIENHINLKPYYSKTLNLNQNYKNSDYHNSLIFNLLKNYFINFNKCILQRNSSFHLLYFDNPNFFFSKKIFFKIGFLQTLQVKAKTLFNLEYPILIRTYLPLRKEKSKKFNFYEPKQQKNKIHSYIFNNLICFASKIFYLSSIKNLDFQAFLHKKINPIRIFYKTFEQCSGKNLIYVNFFSPSRDGEVIYTNSKKQKSERSFIILTQLNLRAFILKDPTTAIRSKTLMLSNFLRYGTIFENQKVISKGGQVIYIDKKSFTIREAIPFLITSKSIINVYQDELIRKGSRLFTFLSHQVKTGDIIQGIPKIEEFFEARLTREGLPLLVNLHTQIKQFFQTYRLKFSIFEATQKSFETIQYLIIDEIQKVYCSQGIYIADKHLEIVVRQMTAKVQVIKGGQTGLLCGELIELDWIRSIEQKFGSEEISYEPIILGITKSCLETESFISAASFQETTRILTKAAIQNKIDFIRGLKQNVILGNLVPAGTGFFSPLYLKYSKVD